jgi:hypothetical protein
MYIMKYMVSDYRLDDGDQGSIPGRGKRIFPLASVSRPALGPTPPPVQRVPGILFLGLKHWPGRDTDNSPQCSAEVKNEGYTNSPHKCLHGM